jgi:hypothetical protein
VAGFFYVPLAATAGIDAYDKQLTVAQCRGNQLGTGRVNRLKHEQYRQRSDIGKLRTALLQALSIFDLLPNRI